MSIEPNSRGMPPPEIVKQYWDGAVNPSQRTVAARMRADGWRISPSTVIRCVNGGFGPIRGKDRKPTAPIKTSPEIDAINQVKAAAPENSDPVALAAAFAEALRTMPDASERIKKLLEMDEQELENQTNKLVKVARHLLAEDLATHTKMMMLVPDKAAKLYAALGTGLVTMLPPDLPEPSHRMIEHNPNEPRLLSPSAQAIADFRAKRGSVAA